ncbi:TOMM precursor leader peptide-binding protein [Longispora urticae]
MTRLTVLAAGDFGAAVASRLAERYPGSEVVDTTGRAHLADWPALDVLVLAAGYDEPPLVEMVERAAFAWRRPWFPVLLEHAQLRCGPVVVPGVTACHVCFRRRRRQHAKSPELWADTPAPVLPGTRERVTGWAPYHVELGVGLAVRAVADAVEPTLEAPGGWVRTVGLVDGGVRRAGVVAVDACGRCRDASARPRRTAELVTTLRAAVAAGRGAGRVPSGHVDSGEQ